MDAAGGVRAEYVDSLVRHEAIVSEAVERAFRAVSRHRFLDGWFHPEVEDLRVVYRSVPFDRDDPTPEQLAEVYSNRALITAVERSLPTSSTSQPSLVAHMLELLDARPGSRVLEIGTGTGYNAALLWEMVQPSGCVHTVEVQRDVADRARSYLQEEGYAGVRVVHRDGYAGIPEAAPFDRIVATVGCSDLSPHWIEQLDPAGSMLIPLQHGHLDPLIAVRRDPEAPESAVGRVVDRSGFMPIRGSMGWVNPWRSFLVGGLSGSPRWTDPLPEELATPSAEVSWMEDPRHLGFHFFLGLASRDHWLSNRGYGLADPGTGSALLVTTESIEGYSATENRSGFAALHVRLLHLLNVWSGLGRPAPSDYEIRFVPKAGLDLSLPLAWTPGREWIIERPFFWEIARLPEPA